MTLIDANYFLRWLLEDVPEQKRVVDKFLNEAPTQSTWLDRLTLAEITYVLRGHGYNHSQIARAIIEFCRLSAVKPTAEIDAIALELYASTVLDFEDCWLAAYAHNQNAELATFDKKLLKLQASLHR